MAAWFLLLKIFVSAQCPEKCLGQECEEGCLEYCSYECIEECAPGCKYNMLSDGICQPECNNQSCNFDFHDCYPRILNTVITLTNSSEIEANLEVAEKNYGKVAGIGLGVFLTIMAMVFGVILCVIGTATPVFFVFMLLGILIPLITFIIVAFAPLHKDQKIKKDTRTDSYVSARILFLITMIVFSLVAIFKIFEYYIGINLKAKGVNSNISSISSADMIAQVPSENPPQGPNKDDPTNPANPANPAQSANPLGSRPGYMPIQENPPDYNPFAPRNRIGEPEEHPLAPIRGQAGNPFLGRNPLNPNK
ncbi:hypothetical protein SteCoe_4299 [Stentor coeruleus]|uniref:Uncharacterized protein n=1 Tax=Stentor coeruleus TaxID=5963 RepID=A0A1R2CV55_9CILI|nr:hypothetical protein SteCoe_4299 [Stentor coeruleus]